MKIQNFKIITPHIFIKSLHSFRKGDMGFCTIASISSKKNCKINNIGFEFKFIENDEQPVLSVKMDSFTINRSIKSTIITGKEQLYTYIKSVRKWVENELSSFFSFHEKSHIIIQFV